ncbi:MAG TPA: alpha-1,2-fucosyltransferase [Pirellulales bacterium]|nr:alpha-1,2-fucosyltransferase [Pirellulales bacterium]
MNQRRDDMIRFSTRLIIANHVGQLANSLLLSAHVMAAAIENKFKVVNIAFTPYAHLFGRTRGSLFCGYPTLPLLPIPQLATFRGKVAHTCRLLRGYMSKHDALKRYLQRRVQDVSIGWSEWCNLDNPTVVSAMRERHFVILDGWHFRAPVALSHHASIIRRFFRPRQIFLREVRSVVKSAKQNCDVLVGVHVRQKDYARWRNGRYFFDVGAYVRWMREMQAMLKGRAVKFLVCSDERYEPDAFGSLPVAIGSGTAICDLYALASCDYIIGPPSTFSLWASFFGGVPLLHLTSVDHRLHGTEQFRVDKDLDWAF